tara:strand:- start:4031 stop:4177 length:147 start_codon:yes stop_codon:yes gene_type:complete
MAETEEEIRKASENRKYDPQKHFETMLAIRDAWREQEEGEEDEARKVK